MRTKMFTLLICALFLGCTTNTATKILRVHAIETNAEELSISEVEALLEAQTEVHKINTLNWENFPYKPAVSFRIGHHNNQIWIKYYIEEDHVLASRTTTNSATHRDSCLEFFIDPKSDGNYYNFEVNAIGTVHLAYGPNIGKRTFVSPKLIEEHLRVSSTLGHNPFEEMQERKKWEMTLVIPAELLVHESGIELSGLQAKANFFKCGDDSTKPHYLSWNPIGTDRPNFHTPEYFGTLIFE